MKTLPVAVQVYSVRDDAERDFKGTMQKIKDMGYDGVELAGLYGMKPAEVKAILEEVGLVPLSAHVPFQELEADIEGTVAQYKEIGMQYIAIPYLMEEDRPGTEKFLKNIETFKKIGEACKKVGITLLYHNHDFEFVKMPNGPYALDYIYTEIPADLLQTELDICGVKSRSITSRSTPAAHQSSTSRTSTRKVSRPTCTSSSALRPRRRKKPASSSSVRSATACRTFRRCSMQHWKPAPSGSLSSRISLMTPPLSKP